MNRISNVKVHLKIRSGNVNIHVINSTSIRVLNIVVLTANSPYPVEITFPGISYAPSCSLMSHLRRNALHSC